MSTALEINGVTLVPIKDAATRVKYSRDYVSRLAREGKIVASQVGRQWYVDLGSLERFALEASTLEEVRKEELRAERRRELMAKESLAALDVVVDERSRRQRLDALVVTTAVTCLGLFVGLGVYTAERLSLSPFRDAAVVVAQPEDTVAVAESPFRVIAEPTEVLVTSITESPAVAKEASIVPMSEAEMEGIVLFSEGTLVDEEAVAALFSDPVEVSFAGEQSGIVQYDKGDGEVAEYPFVRIPVVEATEGNDSAQ